MSEQATHGAVATPVQPWTGLLQAQADLGWALGSVSDPVAESFIRAAMDKIREHVLGDIHGTPEVMAQIKEWES